MTGKLDAATLRAVVRWHKRERAAFVRYRNEAELRGHRHAASIMNAYAQTHHTSAAYWQNELRPLAKQSATRKPRARKR